MYEDVHQVANFTEIELNKEIIQQKMKEKLARQQGKDPDKLNNFGGQIRLKKRYSGQAKIQVAISILMQIVLLTNLCIEVFKKKIEPSGTYLPLRLVLMIFMVFLFSSEETSITKTRYLIHCGKIGKFLRFTNYMRTLLSNITFGAAMWQVFSAAEDDTSVVQEIMDFAALLIVIQLDEFLMATPGQQHCKKFYGDKFLQHTFTIDEKAKLLEQINFHSCQTWGEWFASLFMKFVMLVFSYLIFGLILLINLNLVDHAKLYFNRGLKDAYDFLGEDGDSS